MMTVPIDQNLDRRVLRVFFPGLLATWPIFMAGIKFIYNDGMWKELILEDHLFWGISFFVALVIIYGVGHIISKIGSTLEVTLEKQFILNKKESGEDISETFYDTWTTYLKKSCAKDKEPIILRYYSTFLNAFFFELSCMVALIFQIIFLIGFDCFYTHAFKDWGIILVVCSSFILFGYLLSQAMDAIETLDELRELINEAI